MATYTIELTELEGIALNTICVSPEEYINDFAKDRARVEIENISQMVVKHCLLKNEAIPSTKEALVQYALDKNLVKIIDGIPPASEV